jgi:hypothetical protein
MKKGIKIAVGIFAVAFLLFSQASNAQSKENRNVKGFTRVNFGIAGDLFVEFGPQFSLSLEGDKDDLDEVITEVSGDKLVIRNENRFNWGSDNNRVTVHITMPELKGLGVSGSGKAKIVDPVTEANELGLSVSGSGHLNASSVTADEIDCSISGSGNITIDKGSADNGDITISGSGNYSGENFGIDHLSVKVSGSGNCLCKAGDTLDATISGSGNVTYAGDPKIDARVSGSGKVRSR